MCEKKIKIPLANRVNREVLKQQIAESNEKRLTISFYKYFSVPQPQDFRDQLFKSFYQIGVLGRVYVAQEGINAQISVPEEKFEEFRSYLYSIDGLNNLRLNVAVEDDGKSFFKLMVKVRNQIVADGINDENFDPSNMGKHLTAKEFNELTSQPNTILVDMRNHYESEVGHFKGAILPDADTFRDELPMVENMLQQNKDKNIVMYCTGGIRCEKASAYLKYRGFSNVFQLEGGIIKYANDIKKEGLENRFIGKNFVFDERLGERITEDIIATCHQCGKPADTHINCANSACHLLFIQCEECAKEYEGCCSTECQDFNKLPEEERIAQRKGIDPGRKVFKKGRMEKIFSSDGLKIRKLKAD